MAWSDPFESLVETLVDDLGMYLQSKGGFAIHEMARIQEVCRDFCYTIQKDVHQATQRDFEAYLESHSSSAQNHDDYLRMLNVIQGFCAATGLSSSIQTDERVHATAPARPRSKRDKVSTLQFDPNSDVMREILALGANKPSKESSRSHSTGETRGVPYQLGENRPFKGPTSAVSKKRVSVNSGLFFPDFGNATLQDCNESTNNPSVATPPRPLEAVPERGKSSEKLSKAYGKINFSMDTALANEAELDTACPVTRLRAERATPHTPVSGVQPVPQNTSPQPDGDFDYASLFDHEDDDSLSKAEIESPFTHSYEKKSLMAENVEEAYALAADDSPMRHNPMTENDGERVRAVEGITYNFSSEAIRKMGNAIDRPKAEILENAAPPIDPNLVGGFCPYTFESVYTIDVPLPNPASMKPAETSIVDRFVFPLAAPVVLIPIAVLVMTESVLIGAVILLLAIVALIAALPDVVPPEQRTPQSTLSAILSAKNGRCYGRAMSLVAVPKQSENDEEQDELDFHELWKNEAAWPKAILQRFKKMKLPEARLIAGSERTNAVLLLIPLEEKQYTLLPLVRIHDRWYITDPTMKTRTMLR